MPDFFSKNEKTALKRMAYCGSFYVEKRRGEKMKRLWEYMKPYKRLAILAPILMLLEVGAELAMPKLMTFMINQGVGTGNTAIITKTGIEMLVIAIIGIIGGIGCLICATLVSQRTGTDLRRAAFEKIQEFSFHNIDTFSTPSLITRLTNDITQIQLVIMICLRMLVRSPLLCIGSIIMAFSINAKIAGMFLIVVVLLAIAVYLILRVAMPKFKMVQEKLDKVNTVMRECLAGIRVVKAFVRHDYEVEKFNEVNQDYKETTVSAFRMMLLMSPVMMILVNGTIIGILWRIAGAGRQYAHRGNHGVHYLFDADDDGNDAVGDEFYVYFQSKNFYRPSGRNSGYGCRYCRPQGTQATGKSRGACGIPPCFLSL